MYARMNIHSRESTLTFGFHSLTCPTCIRLRRINMVQSKVLINGIDTLRVFTTFTELVSRETRER